MLTRVRHLCLGLAVLPGLVVSGERRGQFGRMRRFQATLPERFEGPVPGALEALDDRMEPVTLPEGPARRLSDVAALLARRSPLGVCLRRSLARRHFLVPVGVPVEVHFGARLAAGPDDEASRSIEGHAWTVVDDRPYHERADDSTGFATLLVWPERPAGDRRS